jgi:hypothetical protein
MRIRGQVVDSLNSWQAAEKYFQCAQTADPSLRSG